jgi:hypothetical protein
MHIPHTHTELPSMHVIQYLGEEMIALAQGRALRTMLLRLSLSLCCVCCHESHEQPQISGNFSLLPFGLSPGPGNKIPSLSRPRTYPFIH